MKLYAIRDWKLHYEKAQTRSVERTTWVPISLKHDGKGYRRLIRCQGGVAVFGAWILIVQVAAKCPTRGVLSDSDGPLTAEDLSFKTGAPEKIFKDALEVLSSREIGWIIATDCDESQHVATIGQDITGQDKDSSNEESCSEPPLMEFPCAGSRQLWPLMQAKVDEYVESFPAVDVIGECRVARQWCIDNVKRRKTFDGMPGFLSRWLSKAQNSGGRSPLRNGRNTVTPDL